MFRIRSRTISPSSSHLNRSVLLRGSRWPRAHGPSRRDESDRIVDAAVPGLQRHRAVQTDGVVGAKLFMQAAKPLSAGGPLGGIKAIQRSAQLLAAAGRHLFNKVAASCGQFEGDDTAVRRISASQEMTRGVQTVAEAGDRRAGKTKSLSRARGRGAPSLSEQQQKAVLGQGNLAFQRLQAAQCDADEVLGRGLEGEHVGQSGLLHLHDGRVWHSASIA
jgi:hypothetical protein